MSRVPGIKYLYAAITVYLVFLTALYFCQRSVLYVTERAYVSPREAHAHPSLKEFPVRTSDGLDLVGWYAPATTQSYTLVFFHGNADKLTNAADIARMYIAAGYGFSKPNIAAIAACPAVPQRSGFITMRAPI